MIGFRSEQFSGEGYRDAVAVMAHETFTMQNSDIPEYLAQTLLSDTVWEEKLVRIANALGNDTGPEDILQFLDEAHNNPEAGIQFFHELLDFLKVHTGNEIKYVLWLCDTTDDIRTYYEYGSHTLTEFDSYRKSNVIIADLGKEGKLYGYTTLPLPIM